MSYRLYVVLRTQKNQTGQMLIKLKIINKKMNIFRRRKLSMR